MKIKESLSQSGYPKPPENQIIHDFQCDALSMQRRTPMAVEESVEIFYPHHAILFIDAYFKSLHYIYPIIDQKVFMERSYVLWTCNGIHPGRPISQSFKALYFAVLSLGALIRTWTEGTINGLGRHAWCNMLFEKAETLIGRPGLLNNLEGVQSLIVMAQVCQQQLDLNLAYTYLGLAIRTAFACGLNRLTNFQNGHPQDSPSLVVSRTWWALYCLETECSVTLGRPDMLGPDCFHNRPPPALNGETETIIIPAMLGLSKITRQISQHIYFEQAELSKKISKASEFEQELNDWLTRVSANSRLAVRFESTSLPPCNLTLDSHYWPKLQILILKIRKSDRTRLILGFPD
jgi:hypothetical protein